MRSVVRFVCAVLCHICAVETRERGQRRRRPQPHPQSTAARGRMLDACGIVSRAPLGWSHSRVRGLVSSCAQGRVRRAAFVERAAGVPCPWPCGDTGSGRSLRVLRPQGHPACGAPPRRARRRGLGRPGLQPSLKLSRDLTTSTFLSFVGSVVVCLSFSNTKSAKDEKFQSSNLAGAHPHDPTPVPPRTARHK